MRWIGLFALAFLLGGCALPAALSFASIAADAGSYMITGKTMSDHGLSLAMDQDCAMVRVLEDGEVCEEEPEYEVAVAALVPLPEGSELDLALASELDLALASGPEAATGAPVAAAEPPRRPTATGGSEPFAAVGTRKERLSPAVPLQIEPDALAVALSYAPEAEALAPASPSWGPPQGESQAAQLDDALSGDYLAADMMAPHL